jgi:tetratricopeptide (TPR) repeat protein
VPERRRGTGELASGALDLLRPSRGARIELKKTFRINSGDLFARINLGVLYEDQEKWKEARREYRKILRITPEDKHIRERLERIS